MNCYFNPINLINDASSLQRRKQMWSTLFFCCLLHSFFITTDDTVTHSFLFSPFFFSFFVHIHFILSPLHLVIYHFHWLFLLFACLTLCNRAHLSHFSLFSYLFNALLLLHYHHISILTFSPHFLSFSLSISLFQ